jgi:hypothetical protein
LLLLRDERLVRTAHFAGTGILNCSRRLFLVSLIKHCRERERERERERVMGGVMTMRAENEKY